VNKIENEESKLMPSSSNRKRRNSFSDKIKKKKKVSVQSFRGELDEWFHLDNV
jgi:hypothetical protein